MAASDTEDSSYREKILEHLFVGELLKTLWLQGVTDAEVLHPEVDRSGYDFVIEYEDLTRHVQLKSSRRDAKTAYVNVSMRLAGKPSGCVVWLRFDPKTLELGPFYCFGDLAGRPLPDISDLPITKHTKGDARGIKAERPNYRRVAKGRFQRVDTFSVLVEHLLGIL